jgi:hypothetical protein
VRLRVVLRALLEVDNFGFWQRFQKLFRTIFDQIGAGDRVYQKIQERLGVTTNNQVRFKDEISAVQEITKIARSK